MKTVKMGEKTGGKKSLRIAAVLFILHGLGEMMALAAFLPGADFFMAEFAGEEFASKLGYNAIMGVLCGISRFIAAAGLLKGRKWAVVYGMILAAITLNNSVNIVPFGIVDFLFALPVLLILLPAWFGREKAA